VIKGLLIFSAIQGLVFSIALISITTPKSVITNRLFASMIFVVSAFLAISSQASYYAQYPKFFLASYALIYLYCPLYSLFTESLASNTFTFKSLHLLNALPATLFLIVLTPYFFMSKNEILIILRSEEFLSLTIVDFVSICLNIYFLWRSWKMIKGIVDLGSHYPKTWAFYFLTIILFITNLAWLYVIIPQLGFSQVSPPYQFDLIYITMSFSIFAFGYILILQSEYFSVQTITHNIRYKNVNIDQTTVGRVEYKIIEVLESTKPYKNASFSLQELADLTGIDKFKLSYTINNSMKSNFTTLINKYKVEEFIRLVNSDEYAKYSMLGIATEAGFSSKSTFYKAFKELKGQTPKEYFKIEQGSLISDL
jgi:AraC-like DNA-binding protein